MMREDSDDESDEEEQHVVKQRKRTVPSPSSSSTTVAAKAVSASSRDSQTATNAVATRDDTPPIETAAGVIEGSWVNLKVNGIASPKHSDFGVPSDSVCSGDVGRNTVKYRLSPTPTDSRAIGPAIKRAVVKALLEALKTMPDMPLINNEAYISVHLKVQVAKDAKRPLGQFLSILTSSPSEEQKTVVRLIFDDGALAIACSSLTSIAVRTTDEQSVLHTLSFPELGDCFPSSIMSLRLRPHRLEGGVTSAHTAQQHERMVSDVLARLNTINADLGPITSVGAWQRVLNTADGAKVPLDEVKLTIEAPCDQRLLSLPRHVSLEGVRASCSDELLDGLTWFRVC